MRKLPGVLLGALLAGGVVACDTGFDPIPMESVPLAAVRYINAVPDTMAMDYRYVDIVTNAGFFDATFRLNLPTYQPIEVGTRTLKVFLSSRDVTVAQTVVYETQFDFLEGRRYTVIHSGYLRTGSSPAASLAIVEDDPPSPAAGRVAVRALNLAGDLAALDIFVGLTTTAGTVPDPNATWTNVAFGSATPYVELDTAALRVAATATGSTTPLLVANTAVPVGLAGVTNPPQSPIPGARIPGSVITVVILPRSVAGSMAPQTAAFTAPAFAFLYDRRPPD